MMKEFNFKLKDALFTGLRKFSNNPRGNEALTECHNLAPAEKGLELHEYVTPINVVSEFCIATESDDCITTETGYSLVLENTEEDWSPVWPWPFCFFGTHYLVGLARLISDNTKMTLNEIEYHESSETFAEYSVQEVGNVSEIDQIDIADFGLFYVISLFGYDSNGDEKISCYTRSPMGVTELPTTNIPKFITCCNFNNQLVIGGVESADNNWKDIGLAGVAWSAIGSADLRPGETHNVAGYRRMPWGNADNGIVYKVHPLGKGVMVFGDGGQAFLYSVSEPVVTFGMRQLPGSGIRSGNHVAGDENILCYIDRNYDLWMLGADLKAEKLGYREYMKALVTHANITLMSYVPTKKCFYISNGNESYVLTEYGLYTTDQMLTSVGDYRGTLYGFWVDGSDAEIRLKTDRLDFGTQGLKTFEGLEFGIHYDATGAKLAASLDFLYDYSSTSFDSVDWTDLSPSGQLTKRITAREFRIKLKGTTYRNATFNFDSILAKIKFPDKRAIRGLMR